MPPNATILMEIIKSRRSIRQFSNKTVSKDAIRKIIDAGRWAPSACNLQHWLFIALTDYKLRERIMREGKAQSQIMNAPVVIVIFCNMSVSPENNANIQSCAAAIQNMSLMAHALGMGTTWIAGFDKPEQIRQILNVPQKYRAIALLMLGFPKEIPKAPPREEITRIVHYNQFFSGDGDFSASLNPKDWTKEQLKTYRARISRRGGKYEFITEDKIDEILSSIQPAISGNNLVDYDSFSGLFLSKLQKISGLKAYGQFMSKEEIESAVMYTDGLIKKNLFAGEKGLKARKADTITMFYRLEHMPSKEQALKNLNAAMVKGGKLIVVTRNRMSWRGLWDILHFHKRAKEGISSRYFLGLQHMGPWKFTTPHELKMLLRKSGFRDIRIQGKYLFPVSEIINTVSFKTRLYWSSPLFKALKFLDRVMEHVGLSNLFGESLIATAVK